MDLARTVYNRDLKVATMRALDSGNSPGDPNLQQWGPRLSSDTLRDLCSRLSAIEQGELNYSNNPVGYLPVPGPNSNTLAHWLLENGDLQAFLSQPPNTPGWNEALYGHFIP